MFNEDHGIFNVYPKFVGTCRLSEIYNEWCINNNYNTVSKEQFGREFRKKFPQLKYTQGFLKSVTGKLSNERFVNNAPAKVVEIERTKQADAEAKIKALTEQIAGLK